MIQDGTPYYPGTGTEGKCFEEDNCGACKNEMFTRLLFSGATEEEIDALESEWDKPENKCAILTDAQVDGIHPAEWIYKNGRPTCTARVPLDVEERG